jgi:hypothetical protein
MGNDSFLILLTALSIVIPLGYQGFCVKTESKGYRKDPKFKDHPEMKGVRKGDKMLYVSFEVEK